MGFYRFLLTVFALAALVSAQGPNEPQQVPLTKDQLDHLLTVLSPQCRGELEQALDAQGDLSNTCQEEIQSTLVNLQRLKGRDPTAPFLDAERDGQDAAARSGSRRAAGGGPKGSSTTVLLVIGGCVTAFIACIGAFVFWVNKQRAALSGKSRKQLGAKKAKREFLANLRKGAAK